MFEASLGYVTRPILRNEVYEGRSVGIAISHKALCSILSTTIISPSLLSLLFLLLLLLVLVLKLKCTSISGEEAFDGLCFLHTLHSAGHICAVLL